MILKAGPKFQVLKSFCGLNPEHLNDDRLGRALEDLEQYFEEIITALSLHVITEFGLNPEEILWDTTSIYFEGDYEDSEVLRFGYGEKPDLKQLKLSLNVEKTSGIPLRADIFEGNRADVAIVVENLKKLRRTLKKEDLLFTGDNAMGTIPNCLKLNSNKIRFIAPCPASSFFEEAFASVTEEELNLLVFADKDGSAKFKVAERGGFINHPDLDKNCPSPGLLDTEIRVYNLTFAATAVIKAAEILCSKGSAAFWDYKKLLLKSGFFVAPRIFLMSPNLRYLRLRSTPSVFVIAFVISSAWSKRYQFSSRRLPDDLFRLSTILEIEYLLPRLTAKSLAITSATKQIRKCAWMWS